MAMLLPPFFQDQCDNFNIIVGSEICVELLLRWFAKNALSPLTRV